MRPGRLDLLLGLLLFGAAVVPFRGVLDLGYTGIDAVPTVAAAHVDSAGGLVRVLGEELRGGVGGNFYYRPATLLSYALDSLLWGWDVRGYQATDLLLHGLAVLAVYGLARRALDRGPWESATAAALFLLHPAAVEVVPALARRQEPLLVIAFCIALVGARHLPRPGGVAGLALGSLLAVTSVERGLVIPAVVGAYLLFWRFRDEPWRARWRRSLAWSALPLAVAVGFFGLDRSLDPGVGATHWAVENAPYVIRSYLHWTVYPQPVVELPDAPAAQLLIGLGGLALLAAVLLDRERRGLVLFALAWPATSVVLLALAGTMNSWYPYSAAPALALGLAAALAAAVEALRGGRRRALRLVAGAAAGVYAAVALLAASPVLRRYDDWTTASHLADRVTRGALDAARANPDVAGLALVNVPSQYRGREHGFPLVRAASIHWPYSLERWLALQHVERPVVVLGASRQVGRFEVPCVELDDAGWLRIWFRGGEAEYESVDMPPRPARPLPAGPERGVEFAWPPPELVGRSAAVLLFDGERFQRVDPRRPPTGCGAALDPDAR